MQPPAEGEGQARPPGVSTSERLQKSIQRIAVGGGRAGKAVARLLALAAVPEDPLGKGAGAPIMQIESVAVDRCGQANTPGRRRASFTAARLSYPLSVREALAHVVQQEVGIGPDQLEGLRLVGRAAHGDEVRRMAVNAAHLIELFLAGENLRLADIA